MIFFLCMATLAEHIGYTHAHTHIHYRVRDTSTVAERRARGQSNGTRFIFILADCWLFSFHSISFFNRSNCSGGAFSIRRWLVVCRRSVLCCVVHRSVEEVACVVSSRPSSFSLRVDCVRWFRFLG